MPARVRLWDFIDRIGRDPAESEDERVRRVIWCLTLVVGAPFAALLGVGYLLLDHWPAAVIMAIAALFFFGQVALFALIGRGLNEFALVSQLACIGFSLAAVVTMGGPAGSGSIVLFGLIGPLYALAFPSRGRAAAVFAAYLASLPAGVVLTPLVPWAQALAPAVEIAAVVVNCAFVSCFVFAALFFFVRERNVAVQKLREAEEKISRLLGSSSGASENLAGWSRAVAREIAEAIGAAAIGVWEVRDREVVELADEGLTAPVLADLERIIGTEERIVSSDSSSTIVPVTGISGELRGAIVVATSGRSWSQSERNLISSFAHQLGSALDMKHLHARLTSTEDRRALSRQEMQEQGISTLQVCPLCRACYDHTLATCPVDGTALDAPFLLPFCLLGRYRLVRILGVGGMGMVLAAWDERLDREVAVKLIRPEHFNNTDLRLRFEREARTVAHIQHPGVISLYDSGELDDGTAYLVMEKLTGCDLAKQFRELGRGTPAQVAALIRQGGAALGAAHRVGVIHRDVKPENIFLVGDEDGFRVKVLDFGLAKSLGSEQGLTQTGMMVGTPAYMSPEQVSGEVLDARTDVYSFAAVCYEALTGRRVAAKGDLGRVMMSVLNDVPPPPSSVVAGLPLEVDEAFASALAKERARRLKSIELWSTTFVDALERVPPEPGGGGWRLAVAAGCDGAESAVTLTRPAGPVLPAS